MQNKENQRRDRTNQNQNLNRVKAKKSNNSRMNVKNLRADLLTKGENELKLQDEIEQTKKKNYKTNDSLTQNPMKRTWKIADLEQ